MDKMDLDRKGYLSWFLFFICFVSELALFMQKQLNVHTDRNLT